MRGEREAEFLAFVQEGIDAAERGDVVPDAQVDVEFAEMITRHKAR